MCIVVIYKIININVDIINFRTVVDLIETNCTQCHKIEFRKLNIYIPDTGIINITDDAVVLCVSRLNSSFLNNTFNDRILSERSDD